MVVDDVILLVLAVWVVPLSLSVFYHLTDPVPGVAFWRRPVDPRTLEPITRILVAQKVSFILLVSFILVVRFTGGFPGREWVALGLYVLLVSVAFSVLIYQRHIQRPFDRAIRRRK